MNGDARRPTRRSRESLRENHGVVKFDGVEYAFGGVESLLGAADNPDEMLIALYHGGIELGRGARERSSGCCSDNTDDLPIINAPSC